jgi:hypothetical protein
MAVETQVLEACERLIDLSAWPRRKINYRGWLDNFEKADRPLAVHMLSRFTYFSNELVDHLFRSAFQGLSNSIAPGVGPAARRDAWRQFCETALVVPVMGERPNPSDSGWGFARKARQLLGFSENRLKGPPEAVEMLASGSSAPIVFVDDFVGSGDQFLRTWTQPYSTSTGAASFASLVPGGRAHYCNVLAAAHGVDRIRKYAPGVAIASGNVIPRDHSFVAIGSAMWPKGMALDGARLARKIGRRLGYTKTDGSLRDWRGYHRLGLGIAMEDSTPDSNLPLFFEEASDWQPLVRRV